MNSFILIDFCVDYIESGKYISPEFRLGNVYDGTQHEKMNALPSTSNEKTPGENEEDEIILYRPVYVKTVDTSVVSNSKQKILGPNKYGLDTLVINLTFKFFSIKIFRILLEVNHQRHSLVKEEYIVALEVL